MVWLLSVISDNLLKLIRQKCVFGPQYFAEEQKLILPPKNYIFSKLAYTSVVCMVMVVSFLFVLIYISVL